MAVPEQTPYSEHTGNGVTTSFALDFQCETKDHLIVLIDDIEPPIETWSLSGGNVVFTTAPAAGKKITAQRNTPFSRTTDYQSYNNSFRPPAVNKDFDWIWWKLQELGVADWILGARIDALKNYVDRKDDELKAYLLEEIRKQGVALDQLDEYYNYLMERLAQIAVDKGWDASFVVDDGTTQKEINRYIARPFKPGKTYLLNERVQLANGDIVKNTISGNTVDPNQDMTGWVDFEGDQKLFNSRTQRVIQSFGAVSGQDCTQALLDAASWSRTNKQPVYDFIGGNYKFSQQLDFSVNGAGLVGAGPYVTTLTWQGAENTTPIVSDQGGKHPVFQLTGKTGTFKWGELVTGARGGKGIVRSFPWEPLQVQTTSGTFAPAEAITGSKSSASGVVLGISALSFGSSIQSVSIRGFNLVADFTRTTDQFNNPTNWFQSCGIYINGARNHSKIGDLVVDGFEFGLYSRMNWMCEYTDTILTVNCKNGIIFDYETNNIKLGVLSVRRGGNAADVNEGVGVQFIGSYSFIASNPIDVEASYCRGIVVEACHGVGLYGGDIENNDKSVRKIIIKGYEGADFANDSKAWARGINLFGMRVHNSLGIQLENGAKQVTIGGNAFSWTTSGTPTGAFAVTVASGHTHIKDICYLETNDIFGQNETLLPNIPFSMQSTTMLAKELNKYHSIESEISTTDVDRIIPIGRFPTNVSVNRVEIIQDTDLTGTAIIDVGAGGTLLAIVNTFNFTPVPTASTPFGYQNMPLVTTSVNRGASVAHVRIRSGGTLSAGKLKIRIYYSLNF